MMCKGNKVVEGKESEMLEEGLSMTTNVQVRGSCMGRLLPPAFCLGINSSLVSLVKMFSFLEVA